MKNNPLRQLAALGQSVWLDYISRRLIVSGELRGLIDDDGLSGITSNPAIFEKAIGEGHDYDEEIRTLAQTGKEPAEIYELLSVADVQSAADAFRPVHEETAGRDGYVSLEVNPHLALDTDGTIDEAHRLWAALDRPNVFIKVPATDAGLPAISQLIGEGINVNVTLLFSLPRYRMVAEAYLTGLETLAKEGKPLDRVASVASFFVSRIDTLVDPMLEKRVAAGGKDGVIAEQLRGQVAVASTKRRHVIYRGTLHQSALERLAKVGARPPRCCGPVRAPRTPTIAT